MQFALIACLIVLFTFPANAKVDNTGLGILNKRSQSPIQSLRMVMPQAAAGTIKPGGALFLDATWSNVWASESTYYLDYEMLDTRALIGYGFNDRFGVALSFDNRNYFGGEMDSFIQSFHDAFNIGQNGRDLVEKGLSRVGRTGPTVDEEKASIFNNNGLLLILSCDLTEGSAKLPAVNLSASVRYGIESAEGFSENHPLDYGFSLGFAKRLSKKWYAHAIVALTFYDHTEIQDLAEELSILMEDKQLSGLLAVGYDVSERMTVLMQYMPTEAAIENIRGLNEPSHEVHLGLKYQTENLGLIEFGVIENVITFDNSPDFGFHLGWEIPF